MKKVLFGVLFTFLLWYQNNAFALSIKERMVEPFPKLRIFILITIGILILIPVLLLIFKKTRKIGIIYTKILVAFILLFGSLGYCVEYLTYAESYYNQFVYDDILKRSEPDVPYTAFIIAFLSGGYLIFLLVKGITNLLKTCLKHKKIS